MNEVPRLSRLNERRASALIDGHLSAHGDLKAQHTGDDEELDLKVFRDAQLIGMGEVKTDIDPNVAASKDALMKLGASIIDLPTNSGDWGVSFNPKANIKELKQHVPNLISLANSLGHKFLSPENLWDESQLDLRNNLERLQIKYMWRQEDSKKDRVFINQAPWGGQVPEVCPQLQDWIDGMMSSHETKNSLEILASRLDLEQRHLVFCIESNTPVPIQMFAMYHGMELPVETLKLPTWLTDLWVLLPRQFQERDIAWRYSPSTGWALIASKGFLNL